VILFAALVAGLAVAAPAANFGNTSMGKKPYGVLLLANDGGGAWRKELASIRASSPGIAIESVETSGGDARAIQKSIDRLKAQHVSKIIAVPLDLVSESAAMDQLRYLFGIREQPTEDRPDQASQGMAPIKPINKTSIVLPASRPGVRRLKSDAALVLTATIDKSPTLAEILASRAGELGRDPSKEAVVLVGIAPRSDKNLEAWKSAVTAIAESVRIKGGFRESAIIWVRDGVRAGQQDKDRSTNKTTLRALTTKGTVVAIPLAPDGKRVGQLLQRQIGTVGYRWNGKGVIGDPRLAEWVGAISKAASVLPDARQYRDDAPRASGGLR
jgi:hypothetical protein